MVELEKKKLLGVEAYDADDWAVNATQWLKSIPSGAGFRLLVFELSELEVDASTDQVLVKADGLRRKSTGGSARRRARAIPEIDEQVFNSGSPVIRKCCFDTAARGPAELRTGVADSIGGRCHIPVSGAERAVDEGAIHSIT